MAHWSVTDPAGVEHSRSSKTRVYTHAIIRQNRGSDSYFVNWSTSQQAAEAESRVQASTRSYIEVRAVKPQTEEQK